MCVRRKWVRGGAGGTDRCSDARPLYFTTTSEPQTLQRLCENDGQLQGLRLEHSKMVEAASGHNLGAAGEVDAI